MTTATKDAVLSSPQAHMGMVLVIAPSLARTTWQEMVTAYPSGVKSRAGTAMVMPFVRVAPSRILSRVNSGPLILPHRPEMTRVPPADELYWVTTAFASRMLGS
ncbi:hypothetical protein [Streptomyces laculatispora]|uniref:hypothetical protein n=1 Tax=Streptomyces laculatispora TaxID=887464 RepID=UPI003513CEA4